MIARFTHRAALASVAALIACPATAQTVSLVTADRAIARACANHAGQALPHDRLENALRYETSSGLPGDTADPQQATQDEIARQAVRALLLRMLAIPGSAQAKALSVSPAPPQSGATTNDWLSGAGDRYTLTCAPKKPAKAPEFAALPLVSVRKGVSELAKMGDGRRTAGSAQVSYDEARTTNLAGETKDTRKLVINGALGIRLFGTEDSYALAFGEYSRSRARIKTEPAPIDPAKNGSADDVDALELGIIGTTHFARTARLTGRLGYISDYETGARYISGGATLTPVTGGTLDLGICYLGSFKHIGFGLRAHCTAAAEADVRYVARKGDATVGPKDYIIAAGPVFGLTLGRTFGDNLKPQDGLVGNLSYRILPVLTGTAPDLKRFEAALAYRWWADEFAFDFGVSFVDGIERKSLASERRFSLTFGILH